MTETIMLWEAGELAALPVGRAWDVVRLPKPAGWRTLQQLRNADAPTGPVLHAAKGVEVWVPVNSLDETELPGARLLARTERVMVPHPSFVAPQTQNGHSWIIAPTNELVLTDAADLVGAYAAAVAEMGPEALQ